MLLIVAFLFRHHFEKYLESCLLINIYPSNVPRILLLYDYIMADCFLFLGQLFSKHFLNISLCGRNHQNSPSDLGDTGRVLARLSKMPVQDSNSKISDFPDLSTNLLQILIPTTFNSPLCQKEHFILHLSPSR